MSLRFPFRRENRRADGFWDVPDATVDNIKGTSVDPYDPVWPHWKQTPPDHGEGEFVSDQPFFDIDEIMQRADYYPPGRALVDRNAGGNPASRQRVGDMPGGNLSRRRLLVGRGNEISYSTAHELEDQQGSPGWRPTQFSPRSNLVQIQDGRPAPKVLDLRPPVATEESIKGTSVDRDNPVWPRWTKWPRSEGERGDFISDEPFYDIDEIEGTVTLYPPGTPLNDTNLDGNPGSRWRGGDSLPGNLGRRRLQVWRGS
jgi:hypothetical protein